MGALWLKAGKSHRAFWALKEALKHKNNSWETWENYARVRTDGPLQTFLNVIHKTLYSVHLEEKCKSDLRPFVDCCWQASLESENYGQCLRGLAACLEVWLQNTNHMVTKVCTCSLLSKLALYPETIIQSRSKCPCQQQ